VTWNSYLYANSNPLAYIDRNGDVAGLVDVAEAAGELNEYLGKQVAQYDKGVLGTLGAVTTGVSKLLVGGAKFVVDAANLAANITASTGVLGSTLKQQGVDELDKTFEAGTRAAEALGKKETYGAMAAGIAGTIKDAAKGDPKAISAIVENLDPRNAGKKAALNVANKVEHLGVDAVKAIEHGGEKAALRGPGATAATARLDGALSGESSTIQVGTQEALTTKGAAAALSSPPKASFAHGQSDGGPGTWEKSSKTPTRAVDREYQHDVTGAPVGTEYRVATDRMAKGEKWFDGYDASTGNLIDAKNYNQNWPRGDIPFSIEKVTQDLRISDAIVGDLDRKVEIVVPNAARMQQLRAIAERAGLENTIIRVQPPK
jgi:hypothetical protein